MPTKKDILTFRNDVCKREVNRGQTEAPYYYILPKKQHDESEFINYLEFQLENKCDENKNIHGKIKPVLKEIDKDIDNNFIYGVISFFNHYRNKWLSNARNSF